MRNPWQEISLDDYENHMKLDSVMQLQTLDSMMKEQLNDYPVSSVMILGVAGGNGLRHVPTDRISKIYGVDINPRYLEETVARYGYMGETLECLCIDLCENLEELPQADMVIANLLVEYIGYEAFQRVVEKVSSPIVSCGIQINGEESWVSDSPYIHVFDGLDKVHHQMEEWGLEEAMSAIGYVLSRRAESPLPNGKKLVRMDFKNFD